MKEFKIIKTQSAALPGGNPLSSLMAEKDGHGNNSQLGVPVGCLPRQISIINSFKKSKGEIMKKTEAEEYMLIPIEKFSVEKYLEENPNVKLTKEQIEFFKKLKVDFVQPKKIKYSKQ